MPDIEETAKAVQEASKLGRDLIKSIRPLEKIARQILGPFGEGYGILTDIVHHKREEINWRFANRKKVYQLALEQIEIRQIPHEQLKQIPPRIAYDYEDGIEREDDEILQQLWANLLVNVSDPQSDILPQKIFKDILNKLDQPQALFLNEMALRIDHIRFYFIVCDAQYNGRRGCELAFEKNPTESKVPTTNLFDSFQDESFFVPWSANKVEATIDILHASGLVHWQDDLHYAQEMFDADIDISKTENPVEIGRIALQNASGIKTFALSQLGEEFARAVSPRPRENKKMPPP